MAPEMSFARMQVRRYDDVFVFFVFCVSAPDGVGASNCPVYIFVHL